MSMVAVTFIFRGYLRNMLKKKRGDAPSFVHHFDRRASIKDVIESLGVPHPVVGTLTVNGRDIGFDYILRDNDIVEAFPLAPPVNPLVPDTLRPDALDRIAFVVDVNAGKLALHLRALGFDTEYGSSTGDGSVRAALRPQAATPATAMVTHPALRKPRREIDLDGTSLGDILSPAKQTVLFMVHR